MQFVRFVGCHAFDGWSKQLRVDRVGPVQVRFRAHRANDREVDVYRYALRPVRHPVAQHAVADSGIHDRVGFAIGLLQDLIGYTDK
ncbi:hypothetical protein D3C81_2145440 [compost metagenome]